jgi:hypothetical protein
MAWRGAESWSGGNRSWRHREKESEREPGMGQTKHRDCPASDRVTTTYGTRLERKVGRASATRRGRTSTSREAPTTPRVAAGREEGVWGRRWAGRGERRREAQKKRQNPRGENRPLQKGLHASDALCEELHR